MNRISKWFQGPTVGSENPRVLTGNVALITGANRGIGKEIARNLVKRGCKVLLLCRDLESAPEAAQEMTTDQIGIAQVYQCDLASLASIRKCASSILEHEETLDYLICNAGKPVFFHEFS